MEGFVYFHRKIINWQWYDEPNVFRLFFHLILTANHKDGNYRGIKIKRGQLLTSRAKLSKKLNLSEQEIRTALRKLNKEEITCKSTSTATMITVNYYDTYQTKQPSSNQHSNQHSNQVATSQQPSSNQVATTNNNVNNVNNDKNDKKKDSEDKSSSFSRFKFIKEYFLEKYKMYPKDLESAIKSHMKVRDSKKGGKDKRAIKLYLKKLEELTGGQIAEMIIIIDRSINSGWTGVFPIKDNYSKTTAKQETYVQKVNREMEEAFPESEQTDEVIF